MEFPQENPAMPMRTIKRAPSSSPAYPLPHTPLHASGLELSGLPSVDFAQDMRNLVKKIQDLRHIGIESTNITLPKICVIGDQSTGKSSLIEGISEIKVPRSAGTCTRCPMEINLSESEPGQPWNCEVYLVKKYFYDGSYKFNRKLTKSHPLGPWLEKEQEHEHFASLTEKHEVQDAIRRAQLATLNPSTDPQDYKPGRHLGTSNSSYLVKFSPNVIRLDISSPGFPNLSFYDLPGVISQAEFDSESWLVPLVENLVKQYISQESCIVLLTLPMTDDATNSSAARIMRSVHGANERALGVLTKPDRVQTGESFEQWMEILAGEKFRLGHGYYVVRNNPDPSVEHSQARDEEVVFFNSHPWATDLVEYRSCFGTKNLKAALSVLLLKQVEACLPGIIEKIDQKAASLDAELATLPEPPSDSMQFFLARMLHKLEAAIDDHIKGGSSEYPLRKNWNSLAADFKQALINTRPSVQLLSDSDKIMFRPDEDRTCFSAFTQPVKSFKLEDIRELNQFSCRGGVPHQIEPATIEALNRQSVQHWDKSMHVFLRETYGLVYDMLMRQLEKVFEQYLQIPLYRKLREIIEEYLKKLQKEHLKHAEENYAIESNIPFTTSMTYLEYAQTEAYSFISKKRDLSRAGCYLDVHGKFPRGDPRRKAELDKVITGGVLGKDEFAQELGAMAQSRGYYEVASARFVDSICQGVHAKLFTKCQSELIKVIKDELQINDKNARDRCLELMAEDPERQRRRTYLLREKNRVNRAQESLVSAKKCDEFESSPSTMRSQLETGDNDLFCR